MWGLSLDDTMWGVSYGSFLLHTGGDVHPLLWGRWGGSGMSLSCALPVFGSSTSSVDSFICICEPPLLCRGFLSITPCPYIPVSKKTSSLSIIPRARSGLQSRGRAGNLSKRIFNSSTRAYLVSSLRAYRVSLLSRSTHRHEGKWWLHKMTLGEYHFVTFRMRLLSLVSHLPNSVIRETRASSMTG